MALSFVLFHPALDFHRGLTNPHYADGLTTTVQLSLQDYGQGCTVSCSHTNAGWVLAVFVGYVHYHCLLRAIPTEKTFSPCSYYQPYDRR